MNPLWMLYSHLDGSPINTNPGSYYGSNGSGFGGSGSPNLQTSVEVRYAHLGTIYSTARPDWSIGGVDETTTVLHSIVKTIHTIMATHPTLMSISTSLILLVPVHSQRSPILDDRR